jgi:hypothetical protein
MKTRVAMVANPWSAYSREPQRVPVTRSRARAAGPDGVQFTAPGWRPMCFRSMEAAERKMQAHPGFAGWVS